MENNHSDLDYFVYDKIIEAFVLAMQNPKLGPKIERSSHHVGHMFHKAIELDLYSDLQPLYLDEHVQSIPPSREANWCC